MAKTLEGKRRFAPIPIETTFEQFRKPGPGPAPELTPSPSPRSASPNPLCESHYYHEQKREKRRFAPQLIDSSRRSRRAGDVGPATRPVDKTDITPHTNHIYSLQRTRKHHHKITGLARRESCDEETADHVYNLAKKEIEKRLQEIALSAFPNSGTRIGGAEHFVMCEGSEDEESEQGHDGHQHHRGRPLVRLLGAPRRRDSTEEDINWHVKEAQDAADRRAKRRIDTRELDEMQLESPPTDTMWLTSSRKETPSPTPFSLGPIGESHMPLMGGGVLTPIGETTTPSIPSTSSTIQPIGETFMPFIPSAPPGRAGDMPYIPAETGFQRQGGGRGGPFGGVPAGVGFGGGFKRNLSPDRNLEQLRKNSPPMLGKDLVFRRCPSPKHTKLEPDHLWSDNTDEENRDHTGEKGLWRGYCYANELGEVIAPVERPVMISTPSIPSSSATDPFSETFSESVMPSHSPMSEEPTPITSPRHSTGPSLSSHQNYLKVPSMHKAHLAATKVRPAEAKGLHMLMGLEDRLRREKAAADREEQIQAEFTDGFVTQVYNYLSLGYPAMARSFDEELSKISRIPVVDLQRDDDAIMDGVGARDNRVAAKGHIRLTEDDDTIEADRCPRWKALKLYIHEWARQHPDLENISPLAWGVRERRGSWGV